MAKAKILAVGKEIKERTVGNRIVKEREIVLGWPSDKYEGYKPTVRSGIKDGRAWGMVNSSIETDAFGGYAPKVDDIVEVSYNQYGRIVSITKAAN